MKHVTLASCLNFLNRDFKVSIILVNSAVIYDLNSAKFSQLYVNCLPITKKWIHRSILKKQTFWRQQGIKRHTTIYEMARAVSVRLKTSILKLQHNAFQ